MPLIHALERRRFLEGGPYPQALQVGAGQAVMLLCLQQGHVAPGETKALVAGAGTFTVLGVRSLAGRRS